MHISMLAIPFSLTFSSAKPVCSPEQGYWLESALQHPKHQGQNFNPTLGALAAGKHSQLLSENQPEKHPRVCFNGNLQNKEITHILSRLDIQINPVLTLPSLVLRHLQPIITLEDHAAELQSEVDLSSIKHGDLHNVAVSGVDGGFYLTDSLLAAAQFACRNLEAKAYVLEYKWTGAKSLQCWAEFTAFLDYDKHAEASSRNAALDQIMADDDMITGPMMDKYADALITPYFRQYAVIKQRAATNNLKYTSTYKVPCTVVPVGKDLLAEYYTAQASDAM
ncbi:hypothetical protein F5877DRAFT_72982 [Lentinula edodes]|nr:hypothetical protein F5877DRAFT_72982 [Lentinula edodes]